MNTNLFQGSQKKFYRRFESNRLKPHVTCSEGKTISSQNYLSIPLYSKHVLNPPTIKHPLNFILMSLIMCTFIYIYKKRRRFNTR